MASMRLRTSHTDTCSCQFLSCPSPILLFKCEFLTFRKRNSICWPAWLLSRGPLHLLSETDWCGKGNDGLWSGTSSMNEPFKYRQTEGHKDKGVSKTHSRLAHPSFTVYQHVKERFLRRCFDCKSLRQAHFDNEDENKLYWKTLKRCLVVQ